MFSNYFKNDLFNPLFIGFFLYFSSLSLRLVFPVPFLAVGSLFALIIFLFFSVKSLSKTKLLIVLCLYVFVVGSFFYSDLSPYGISKSFWMLSSFLLLLLVSVQKTNNLFLIKCAIETVSLIFLPIFLFHFILYIFSDFNVFNRFDLNDANPIIIAQIFLVFSISLITSRKRNLFRLAAGFSYFIMAVMTGSKGPILGTLVGIGLLVVLTFINPKKFIYLIMMVIVLTLLYIVLVANMPDSVISDYIFNRYLGESSGNSVNSRLTLYFSTFDAIGRLDFYQLIFGAGIGSFSFYYTGFDDAIYPHNIFLESILELGFIYTTIFFGALIYLLIKIYFKLYRFKNNKDLVFIWLFGCLAVSTSMFTGDLGTNWLVYMFMGMALSGVGFVKK
ncbi:O-antigen ligase family protein [Shewanella sp. MSW]|uniref:O-antigen ligase family protein n=1 Tax=Shewanella sp. MSW TaxID=2569536 RepID=UPI00118579DB|nr:O-antigen ligase family protein [Shewanella sp. MSW]TVP09755.1 hypothetical protein AYI96_14915 [Shewanella sp. MSW]